MESEPHFGKLRWLHYWTNTCLAFSPPDVVAQVARLRHVRAIRGVAHVWNEAEERRGQGRSWSVQVRANGLRVVQAIAGQVHCGAVGQVAHTVAQGALRERRSGRVKVRADGLRVIHRVARQVHRVAIWQVADIVVERKLVGRLLTLRVVEAGRIESAVVRHDTPLDLRPTAAPDGSTPNERTADGGAH